LIIVLIIYAILNVVCAEICCPAVGKQNHESRARGTQDNQPWMESPLREQIKKFQDTQVVAEFLSAVESKTIKEIYWCGGEPLMWDIHWQAMQRIIELGFAKDVYVRYNTNLSRTSFKKASNCFDLLPQFQDWQICASLDGTKQKWENTSETD
jgi:hypothetical protein